jgi:type II secretory pathway component PulC
MTPTGSLLKSSQLWTTLVVVLCLICGGSLLINTWYATREIPNTNKSNIAYSSPSSHFTPDSFSLFFDLGVEGISSGTNQADVRLVGTFFEYDEIGTNCNRHAVLADIHGANQAIVVEGQHYRTYDITRIERDSVTVERTSDRTLYILRLAGPESTDSGWINPTTSHPEGTHGVATPMNFGGQIASNHWVLNRQGLLSYYQELRDNPDRLLNVFDTMKPLRNEAGLITGYTVGIEGEKGFFDSVGLSEGDVVRQVNKRPMTNRRMAERFIADFVKGSANAFVIEVERNGSSEELTYQIR